KSTCHEGSRHSSNFARSLNMSRSKHSTAALESKETSSPENHSQTEDVQTGVIECRSSRSTSPSCQQELSLRHQRQEPSSRHGFATEGSQQKTLRQHAQGAAEEL